MKIVTTVAIAQLNVQESVYHNMKKFLKEFKEFATKGDVMNLAVGIIIGGAFQSIVNSLVKDIISPIIGLVANTNFDYLILKIGNVEIKYGSFITAIINFLIMAFIIFMLVKGMNALTNGVDKMLKIKKEDSPAPTTKICPYCKSEIDINATRCPHCTSEIN